MLFGSHVSIAGGILNAPKRAHHVGCDVMQTFSRSPRGGKAPVISQSLAQEFKKLCKKYNIQESYIHTPYFINLASKNPKIRWGSINVLKEELERASILGVKYLMTHLGSAKDYGRKKSVEKVKRAVHHTLEGYTGSTKFLLEQSAGAGGEDGIIGGSLEELATIYHGAIEINKAYKKHLGICIDTCHAFAFGYDLRDKKSVDEFVKKIDKTVGLKQIKLLHFNDSKFKVGEHKDRHEHIGKGYIGEKGFKSLINHPKLKHLNTIIETPKDKTGTYDKMNLKLLRDLQKQ